MGFQSISQLYTAIIIIAVRKYVTKSDEQVLESSNHPDLWNSKPLRTTEASSTVIAKSHNVANDCSSDGSEDEMHNSDKVCESTGRSRDAPPKKKRRMSRYKLTQIIINKGIKNRLDLLGLAHSHKAEGKTDIAEFIINCRAKAVNEVIDTAWELNCANEKLTHSKKS